MEMNWVTIRTDTGLMVQINPESIEMKDNGYMSVDTMVYTQKGEVLNKDDYQTEIAEAVNNFLTKALEENDSKLNGESNE